MDSKKKCRQYSADYIKYGFVKSPCNEQLPMCLLCDQVFSNEGMKPSRMIVHLKSRHGDKSDNDVEFFKNLRDNRKTLGGMFGKVDKQNIDGLVASYNISLLIAKTGKPHTIGDSPFESRSSDLQCMQIRYKRSSKEHFFNQLSLLNEADICKK